MPAASPSKASKLKFGSWSILGQLLMNFILKDFVKSYFRVAVLQIFGFQNIFTLARNCMQVNNLHATCTVQLR
jgi:hypothetical protein